MIKVFYLNNVSKIIDTLKKNCCFVCLCPIFMGDNMRKHAWEKIPLSSI